jgi:hypothetical protein
MEIKLGSILVLFILYGFVNRVLLVPMEGKVIIINLKEYYTYITINFNYLRLIKIYLLVVL